MPEAATRLIEKKAQEKHVNRLLLAHYCNVVPAYLMMRDLDDSVF